MPDLNQTDTLIVLFGGGIATACIIIAAGIDSLEKRLKRIEDKLDKLGR